MIGRRRSFTWWIVSLVGVLSLRVHGQVTSERLAAAPSEAQNWLTYSGNYSSTRYSPLNQITPTNVKNLKLQWVYQSPVAGNWQTTPLVVDGTMYITQRLNDVVALDAATGRAFWIYRYTPAQDRVVCCGANNRGLGILGDTLFMGTLDAQLIAIDRKTGRVIWKTEVASTKSGYSITHAPLVVKNKVIVGVGGGEYGIRGFIAAYDAVTGREAWRFYTIPAPGEPGSETWERCPPEAKPFCDPEAWKHGGGSIWMTGAYDPRLNLTYWGTGNVGPDYNGVQRPGDNLYTASIVALDADTGTLKWHYQFTPHDVYDYDSVQVPVLVDNWAGSRVNVVTWANRNGNFYALDRETGRFLLGKPFVKVNWMSGFDERGRRILIREIIHQLFNPHGVGWRQAPIHDEAAHVRVTRGIDIDGKRRKPIVDHGKELAVLLKRVRLSRERFFCARRVPSSFFRLAQLAPLTGEASRLAPTASCIAGYGKFGEL